MLEKAKANTAREGRYTSVEYVRWADDLVIMVDHFKKNRWIVDTVQKRLHEEFTKLGLEMNEQKTKVVDLKDIGSCFSYLGFDFRSIRTKTARIGIIKTPKKSARVKLQQKLKHIFKTKRSRSIKEVIDLINPILRGWVNYYRIGNSTRCFNYVRDYVEKKIRRHIYKSKQQRGFGWKRWSKQQIYQYSGVFNDYQIEYTYR